MYRRLAHNFVKTLSLFLVSFLVVHPLSVFAEGEPEVYDAPVPEDVELVAVHEVDEPIPNEDLEPEQELVEEEIIEEVTEEVVEEIVEEEVVEEEPEEILEFDNCTVCGDPGHVPTSTPPIIVTATTSPNKTPTATSSATFLIEPEVVEEAVEEEEIEEINVALVRYDKIETGITYNFRGEHPSIIFNTLPSGDYWLEIEEIHLSESEQEEFGSLSSVVHDVRSNLENGSFNFDLSLALPDDSSEELEVRFAEGEDDLTEARLLESEELSLEENSITIEGLDHFTIFFVTDARARTTHAASETIYSVGVLDQLKTSDDDRLASFAWPVDAYEDNWYAEFRFSPSYASMPSVDTAKINIELRRGRRVNEVRLMSWDGSDFVAFTDNVLSLPLHDTDYTLEVAIPSSHVDTLDKLNNYKFRLQAHRHITGKSSEHKTYYDYVALNVTEAVVVATPDPTPVVSSGGGGGGPINFGVGPSILNSAAPGAPAVLGASTDVLPEEEAPLWSKQAGFIDKEILDQLIENETIAEIEEGESAGQVLGASVTSGIVNDERVAALEAEVLALKLEVIAMVRRRLTEIEQKAHGLPGLA